jgi:hypothetical protein
VAATSTQLEAVVSAANALLGARQDQMVTVEEWANLARAVAVCTGRKTADLLTERDLEQAAEDPPLPWNEAIDGPLPNLDD